MIVTFLILYLVLLIVAARFLSKRMQSVVDFYLAGRTLPMAAITMAFVASWFGAASSVGTVNQAYQFGLSAIWFMALPSVLSVLFIGFVMAKRVRTLESVSMPEVIEKRYGLLGSVLMACILLFVSTTLIASQLVAAGQLIQFTSGLPPAASAWIIMVAVIIYSILGGFRAVVMTDVLQFFLFTTAILFLAAWTGIQAHWQIPPAMLHEGYWDPWVNLKTNLASTFTFLLAWSIAPEMWQRLSAVRKPEEAKKSALISCGILTVLFIGVISTGMLASGILSPAEPWAQKNTLIALTHHMSPLLAAFVLVGFLSAISSTIDSSLNIACLSVTRDIIYRTFWRRATERQLVLLSRVAMVFIGWPAISIALYFQNIMQVLWISADMYASTMLIPVMGVFFMPNAGRWAGGFAMVLGGLPVLIGFLGQLHWIELPSWYPMSPFTTLVGIVMSTVGFGLGHVLSQRVAQSSVLAEPQPAESLG